MGERLWREETYFLFFLPGVVGYTWFFDPLKPTKWKCLQLFLLSFHPKTSPGAQQALPVWKANRQSCIFAAIVERTVIVRQLTIGANYFPFPMVYGASQSIWMCYNAKYLLTDCFRDTMQFLQGEASFSSCMQNVRKMYQLVLNDGERFYRHPSVGVPVSQKWVKEICTVGPLWRGLRTPVTPHSKTSQAPIRLLLEVEF